MIGMKTLGVRCAALLALGLVGCGTTDLWWYSCPEPDRGHLASDGTHDPCHYKDQDAGADDAGPDTGEGCPPNECVKRTWHWEGPIWLWFGPVAEAPACPPGPTGPVAPAWEGNRDLVYEPRCETCTCEPSTGSCILPSALTASTVACNQSGGTSISFDAPMSWDGTCDSTNSIPAGAVSSLTIPPLTVMDEGCAPSLLHVPRLIPPVVPVSWKTLARACHGQGWLPCGNPLGTCIPPDALPPSGFRLCIAKSGDENCDDPEWPEYQVFYKGFEDGRQCSECTCDPPTGSMCTARLSVYANTDNACSGPVVDGDIGLSSEKPTCTDINPSGQPLGSKSATPPTYLSGTCTPGENEGTGEAKAIKPETFCCKR